MQRVGDGRSTRPSEACAWSAEQRAKPANTGQTGCMLHMAKDCESHITQDLHSAEGAIGIAAWGLQTECGKGIQTQLIA